MDTKKHTDRRYAEALEALRSRILTMGGRVEEIIREAVASLVEHDGERADHAISLDQAINLDELAIDDLCLKILALRQPAASDLRLVTTALKLVTDLERVGDLAVNIAERSQELAREPILKPLIDLPRMADCAQTMIHAALDAFVAYDAEAADEVFRMDQEVDELFGQVFRELLTYMMEDPRTIQRATRLLFVGKYLERIADHATNVAEDVVFMVRGKDVRHPESRRAAGFIV